jgi:predicted chitinase
MTDNIRWAYRAPYDVYLFEVGRLYKMDIDSLLRANRHLRNVCSLEPGDVVFLPINASNRDALRKQFPAWRLDAFEHVDKVSEFEAALIRSGVHTAVRDNSNNFIPIDRKLLQTIIDRCVKIKGLKSRLNLDVVADALNQSMHLALATTRRREVGFLSQAVIETDYFRTFEEYGKGKGHDYGNYYGRGIHQLTWKETYQACSKAVFGDLRLVENPDLIISDINTNIKATAWFWRDYKPFNSLADAENIDEIIRRLYGGTINSKNPKVRRSVELRRSYYKIIRITLNQRYDRRI